MSAQDIINERTRTHGDFADVAEFSQRVRSLARRSPGWSSLSNEHKEALECVVLKIARVLSGNANEADHWRDIQGYALLAEHACVSSEGEQ